MTKEARPARPGRREGNPAFRRTLFAGAVLLLGILYYIAAIGGFRLPVDISVIKVEPILFVLLGYFFGRLPARQQAHLLQQEIHWQSHRADAAQHAKEQAIQAQEAVEERLKNVRIALDSMTLIMPAESGHNSELRGGPGAWRTIRSITLNILNS
jgi:hypothetical protein